VTPLPITRRQAITAVLGLVVVLLLAARWHGHTAPAATPSAVGVHVRATPAVRPKVFVHVAGAVRRPGLYTLRDGARVADALARAGGTTRKANLEAVNLAAPVVDGQQVLVPRSTPAGSSGAGDPGTPSGPVSLSAATVEQLDELPGVGPVTAQKIVDYRAAHGAFRSVEELDAVPGIGPARIETLRDLVVP
jgi:competence protein ComEA